jgi:predicted lactoylglutathione lyase
MRAFSHAIVLVAAMVATLPSPVLAGAEEPVESSIPKLPEAPELFGQVTFLNCKDLAAVSQFYRTMLGRGPDLDMGYVQIYKVTPNIFVGLLDKDHGTNRPSPIKPVMLSFLAKTPEEVDQWYARLKAMNAEITHVPAWGTPKNGRKLYYMRLKDPEGYYIEVFAWVD